LPFSLIGLASKWLKPQGFVRSLKSSLSDSDEQFLADENHAEFFARVIQEGFRQGVRGPAVDALLLYDHWGFSVGEIQSEVELFHGIEDQFAPFEYAQYLDEQLPRSTLNAYPGKGHLILMTMLREVFEKLP
jgi:pimeloyl-ACP methyl ester carboxylesterase